MAVIVCGTINSVRSKICIISSELEKLGYSVLHGFFLFQNRMKFFIRTNHVNLSYAL